MDDKVNVQPATRIISSVLVILSTHSLGLFEVTEILRKYIFNGFSLMLFVVIFIALNRIIYALKNLYRLKLYIKYMKHDEELQALFGKLTDFHIWYMYVFSPPKFQSYTLALYRMKKYIEKEEDTPEHTKLFRIFNEFVFETYGDSDVSRLLFKIFTERYHTFIFSEDNPLSIHNHFRKNSLITSKLFDKVSKVRSININNHIANYIIRIYKGNTPEPLNFLYLVNLMGIDYNLLSSNEAKDLLNLITSENNLTSIFSLKLNFTAEFYKNFYSYFRSYVSGGRNEDTPNRDTAECLVLIKSISLVEYLANNINDMCLFHDLENELSDALVKVKNNANDSLDNIFIKLENFFGKSKKIHKSDLDHLCLCLLVSGSYISTKKLDKLKSIIITLFNMISCYINFTRKKFHILRLVNALIHILDYTASINPSFITKEDLLSMISLLTTFCSLLTTIIDFDDLERKDLRLYFLHLMFMWVTYSKSGAYYMSDIIEKNTFRTVTPSHIEKE